MNFNRTKIALFIFFIIMASTPVLLCGQTPSGAKNVKINKVVIDPGHGGKHPGCVYKSCLEKDITLSIGLKLGELIRANYPGVEIIYTRTTDKYVDLDERGQIANKAGADLFISIHINSAEATTTSGTSTYVMGIDKGNKNLDVAMKENDVVIYEEDYSTRYEGYTPGDPASYIMFSLMQSAYLDQSMQLAEIVQKHFASDLPMRDLGARQGPFLVLWRTSMPSILTEIGFLSNEKDRAYITTNKGQSEAARSLFNAFSEYKSKVEGRADMVLLKPQSSLPDVREQLPPADKAAIEAAIAVADRALTASDVRVTPAVEQPAETGSAFTETARQTEPASTLNQGVRFYVQVSFLSRPKSVNSVDFKSYRGLVIEKPSPKGGYKYLVEGSGDFSTTYSKLATVRKEFKDAFIVAYDGDTQIPVDEARRRVR